MEEKEKKTRTRRVKAKEESPKDVAAKEIKAQAESRPKPEEAPLKNADAKAEAPKAEPKPYTTPKNTEAKTPIAKETPKAEPKPSTQPNAEAKTPVEAPKAEPKPSAQTEAKTPIAKFTKSSISDIEVAKKLINIYQSAQDRKLQFNLSFEYVKRMLEYKTCYYTGKTFTEDGPNARSFDRVDSDKGYIEGNVVACTIEINGKKSNLSFEEISCLYHKLAANKEKSAKKESEKSAKKEEDFSFSLEDQK